MLMYKEERWDLKEIKVTSLASAMKSIEKKVVALEKKRKKLTSNISVTEFMKIVKEIEALHVESQKLGVYVHLRFCENSFDQKAVADMSLVENFLTSVSNRLLFFSFWFKELPSAKAKQLVKASGKYWYHFDSLLKTKKYTLSEKEEKLINVKDTTGVSALNNIYSVITSGFEYDFKGKIRTQEEMVTYVRSTSPAVRKEAYQALLAPYKKNKAVLGEIYKNILNDWRQESVELRGYKSPIAVRNMVNDIPDKAIEVLLKVCDKNQHLFHKFFDLKRKKLGLKKLRRYDVYAPLKEEKGTISYDKAVTMVLDTFAGFSSKFKDAASLIIYQGHIHSKVIKGKRSGAFCCSAGTSLPPYVLLSYTGKYRDVSTLAHELGHGIHYTLSSFQTEFTNGACLPLAETASIFSEMLLSEKVMKENPKAAKEMIFRKVDDLYASIIRQATFVQFEVKAHQMMREGKTIDEMSSVYLQMLKKQVGPKVEVDDIFAYEWAYIPHIFHTPFYCYAYAFGNLLTLALYEMYKEQGEKFVPKVIKMLAMGGSAPPVEIAKIVGADITSEKFWQKGFDVIKEMIEKLE